MKELSVGDEKDNFNNNYVSVQSDKTYLPLRSSLSLACPTLRMYKHNFLVSASELPSWTWLQWDGKTEVSFALGQDPLNSLPVRNAIESA